MAVPAGRTGAVLAGLLLLVLAALPFVAGDYLLGVGLMLLMWAALTQSWCVLSQMTGYVSLGHVVFYGLGAYLVVVTWQSLPLWIAIPLSGVVAAAFAALVGLPVLRVRGLSDYRVSLNGVEVARGGAEDGVAAFDVPARALRAGANALALEGFSAGPGSVAPGLELVLVSPGRR